MRHPRMTLTIGDVTVHLIPQEFQLHAERSPDLMKIKAEFLVDSDAALKLAAAYRDNLPRLHLQLPGGVSSPALNVPEGTIIDVPLSRPITKDADLPVGKQPFELALPADFWSPAEPSSEEMRRVAAEHAPRPEIDPPLEEQPLNGYVCMACGLPQRSTLSGATCAKGHGGDPGRKPRFVIHVPGLLKPPDAAISTCPSCGHRIYHPPEHEDSPLPLPGDQTRCHECGAVLVFGAKLSLRFLTPEDPKLEKRR